MKYICLKISFYHDLLIISWNGFRYFKMDIDSISLTYNDVIHNLKGKGKKTMLKISHMIEVFD